MKAGRPFALLLTIILPHLDAQDLAPLRREIDLLAAATAQQREDRLADLRDVAIRAKLLDTKALAELPSTEADAVRTAKQILAYRRADVNTGASSGSSGSTSAVLSPLLPAIFGFSFENGGLTRSVSGSTISLKANPAGLFCASGGEGARVAQRDTDVCKTFWKRFALAASFDTARGEKQAALADLQTLNNQFAEFTLRVELVNHRTVSGDKFAQIFKSEISGWRKQAQRFVDLAARSAAEEFETRLRDTIEGEFVKFLETADFKDAEPEKRAKLIERKLLSILQAAQGEITHAADLRRAWLDSLKSHGGLQAGVANALVVTAEYGLQKPDLAKEAIGDLVQKGERPPSLHSLRLIAAKGVAERKLDLTANAAAAFFAETRPGMKGAFRDFRFGLEGKFGLRDLNGWGAPSLSFAGLYVYLHQEPIGLGLVAFNQAKISQPGHIGLFQTKFELPTANNAIRIPLSFSYSNRTELIKESDVRGQIGISFNLDALFAEKK